MSSPFRSGSLLSLGAVAFAAMAILVQGKLLTNALDAEAVGQVVLALLVAESLGMLFGLGLPAAVPKLIAETETAGQGQLRSALLRSQGTFALAAALVAAMALATRPWWPSSVALLLPEAPFLIAVLPALVGMITLRDFLLAAAAGSHAYGVRASAMVTMSALQMTLFATLYVWGEAPPIGFVGTYAIATLAGCVILLARLPDGNSRGSSFGFRRPAGWTAARERETWRAALSFACPLYVNNLMNVVYQRVDTLLIVMWLGLEVAAVFEMTKRVPNLLSRLLRAALAPYLPSLAGLLGDGHNAEASALVWRCGATVALVGYGLTLVLVALAKPLLSLLFTADYLPGMAALGPLLLATCLAVQAGIMGQALIALDRPRQVMVLNFGLAVASLLLNLLLVPRYGMAGAGWSAVAAAGLSLLLQQVAVRKAGISRVPVGYALLHPYVFLAFSIGSIFGEAMAPRLGIALLFVVAALLTAPVVRKPTSQEVHP